ncbi:unnamed protein product [Chrysodeixis includens]|uniref:Uncharacterized protein n=1 Tax=Chrysodeixis includens TaxID=689277 RepID=A0A9N8KY72_CHRIL|nr:unnamed protein product [Chrysodeixis includens]
MKCIFRSFIQMFYLTLYYLSCEEVTGCYIFYELIHLSVSQNKFFCNCESETALHTTTLIFRYASGNPFMVTIGNPCIDMNILICLFIVNDFLFICVFIFEIALEILFTHGYLSETPD